MNYVHVREEESPEDIISFTDFVGMLLVVVVFFCLFFWLSFWCQQGNFRSGRHGYELRNPGG